MSNGSRKNRKSNKRLYSLLILVATFVFGIYFCVTFIKQEINISQLEAEAKAVQEKVDEQVQYSKELEDNMKPDNELKRVEETAREKLGYLKNDEVLFIDSSEK
ncbi:MAG: septum formation initiator family protein [Clostridia bacterium]|nr:septum formation initiator family protein [Clostridia bacterium]